MTENHHYLQKTRCLLQRYEKEISMNNDIHSGHKTKNKSQLIELVFLQMCAGNI